MVCQQYLGKEEVTYYSYVLSLLPVVFCHSHRNSELTSLGILYFFHPTGTVSSPAAALESLQTEITTPLFKPLATVQITSVVIAASVKNNCLFELTAILLRCTTQCRASPRDFVITN